MGENIDTTNNKSEGDPDLIETSNVYSNSSSKNKKKLLFICTGNICRSPMAEYLMKQKLGENSDWEISSAGLFASTGVPASLKALNVLRQRGIEMRAHRSRMLTLDMVKEADIIVVMTELQFAQLTAMYPFAENKTFVLGQFAEGEIDINDPIGLTDEVYEDICKRIEQCLNGLLEFIKQMDNK